MKTKSATNTTCFAITLLFFVIITATLTDCQNTSPVAAFTVVAVPESDTELAKIITADDSSNERLLVLGTKNSAGDLLQVTGGGYVDESGASYTFWYGPDGLPQYIVTQTGLFKLANFTSDSVDVIMTDLNGNIESLLGITVDSEAVAALRDLHSKASAAKNQGYATTDGDLWKTSPEKGMTAGEWFKTAFWGAKIVCCVGTVMCSAGSVGTIVPCDIAAYDCCTGAVLGAIRVYAMWTDNEDLEQTIRLVTCMYSASGCAESLGVGFIAGAIDFIDQNAQTVVENENLGEGEGECPYGCNRDSDRDSYDCCNDPDDNDPCNPDPNNPYIFIYDNDLDGYSVCNDPDDNDPCNPDPNATPWVADNDWDGYTRCNDPDDNDPCNPDPNHWPNAITDDDLDGYSVCNDPDDNDPCNPDPSNFHCG